jgi:hypothetical protein
MLHNDIIAHANTFCFRFIDYYEDESFYYLVTELHGTRWDASQTLPSSGGLPSGPLVNIPSTDTISSSSSSQRTPMDLFEYVYSVA